jgi:hypothetical protein
LGKPGTGGWRDPVLPGGRTLIGQYYRHPFRGTPSALDVAHQQHEVVPCPFRQK